MKADQHSGVSIITEEIYPYIKKQTNPKVFELEIKVAKLKKTASEWEYKKIAAESVQAITVVNGRPGAKNHKINSGATKLEYDTVNQKCSKLCKEKQTATKLDLKFGKQKFSYRKGLKNWALLYKQRKIKRQYEILNNRKEFRLDVSQNKLIDECADDKLLTLRDRFNQCLSLMRFIFNLKYYLGNDIKIVTTLVFETEDREEYQRFKEALLSNDEDDMDDYIDSVLEKNRGKADYQIELRLTVAGNEKIMKMSKSEVNAYIGDLVVKLTSLIDQGSEEKDIEQMMKGLKL